MSTTASSWHPLSWQGHVVAQDIAYPDPEALQRAVAKLRQLPPLVTSWEVERLRRELSEAEEGRRFVLQGGDCAESVDDCNPASIANRLKILLQMSLVLVHGMKKPVVRIGRMAGQYAKPRSSASETRDGPQGPLSLPSYFGDLINRPAFDAASRTPDPRLLLEGYYHAGLTINFVRSLVDGGFADLHHPEYWDLTFLKHAGLPKVLREQYEKMRERLADGLRFMEALGETTIDDLTRVEFYTSHEGLSLWYESALTRTVPRRDGFYDLSTHLPWIGERTRALDGAHVAFFAGIRNPVGVKIGPKITPDELLALASRLNPANEAGKLVLIARMGVEHVAKVLPPLLRATRTAGVRCLWLCDPMHGNTRAAAGGLKTRRFDDILRELTLAHGAHIDEQVALGGVHFELTADDVTECVGGAAGVTEDDLTKRYTTGCDPRLNYQQAMELAFVLASMRGRSEPANERASERGGTAAP